MKATWFLEQIKSPVVSSKFPLGGGSRRVACVRVCARARPRAVVVVVLVLVLVLL